VGAGDFFHTLYFRPPQKSADAISRRQSERLVRIRVILSEIPWEELNAVFLGSIERLGKCIDTNGEDVG
jgi:hypothetical protein